MKTAFLSIPLKYEGFDTRNRYNVVQDIREYICNLKNAKLNIRYWGEGYTYSDNDIRDSEVFIFTHEKNKGTFYLDEMASGVRKELELAMSLNKKVFLAYYKKDGTLGFYDIDHQIFKNFKAVRGLTGTSEALKSYIYRRNTVDTNGDKKIEQTKPNPDRRLLLTIK